MTLHEKGCTVIFVQPFSTITLCFIISSSVFFIASSFLDHIKQLAFKIFLCTI